MKFLDIFNKLKSNITEFYNKIIEKYKQKIIKNQKEKEYLTESNLYLLHYNFYEQIQDKLYNKNFEVVNQGKFKVYIYNFTEYLQNPKILWPDLIENKTFFLRSLICKDDDLDKMIPTKINLCENALKISDYNYFIYNVFLKLHEYEDKCNLSGLNINIMTIEISVWQ